MGLLSSAATVFLLCACGTGLTLYAVHVQRSRQDDSGYRALCDVDDVITCSEIITDEYVWDVSLFFFHCCDTLSFSAEGTLLSLLSGRVSMWAWSITGS